jgi:phasin family protein
MMIYNNDTFMASQQAGVEAFSSLSEKAFASFEKLVQLNMGAAKAALSQSLESLQTLAAAKDAQSVLALQSGLLQPLSESASAYSRSLYEIVSGASADLTSTFESTHAESQKNVAVLLENSLKSAPAGSEAAVAAIRSAVTAGNQAVESAKKAAKQAVQLVESNVKPATSTKAG